MEQVKIGMNAETANAIIDALGAVVMALAEQLPAERKTAFAANLVRLRDNALAHDKVILAAILHDVAGAAAPQPRAPGTPPGLQ